MTNKSCEIKYYKFSFILWLIFCSVISLPLIILIFISKENKVEEDIFYLILLSFLFYPFLVYYGYKLIYYIKLEPLYLQEVKLEKVESSWNRLASFSLYMDIEGKKKKLNTLAIFNVGLIGPNMIDEYSSKKALVGYDKKNDVAVVLRVID